MHKIFCIGDNSRYELLKSVTGEYSEKNKCNIIVKFSEKAKSSVSDIFGVDIFTPNILPGRELIFPVQKNKSGFINYMDIINSNNFDCKNDCIALFINYPYKKDDAEKFVCRCCKEKFIITVVINDSSIQTGANEEKSAKDAFLEAEAFFGKLTENILLLSDRHSEILKCPVKLDYTLKKSFSEAVDLVDANLTSFKVEIEIEDIEMEYLEINSIGQYREESKGSVWNMYIDTFKDKIQNSICKDMYKIYTEIVSPVRFWSEKEDEHNFKALLSDYMLTKLKNYPGRINKPKPENKAVFEKIRASYDNELKKALNEINLKGFMDKYVKGTLKNLGG